MKKIQVAIIGTNIGAKHYEDFQKVSDKFNVHTICGITTEPIENILPANSDTKISLNFEDVLKKKRLILSIYVFHLIYIFLHVKNHLRQENMLSAKSH